MPTALGHGSGVLPTAVVFMLSPPTTTICRLPMASHLGATPHKGLGQWRVATKKDQDALFAIAGDVDSLTVSSPAICAIRRVYRTCVVPLGCGQVVASHASMANGCRAWSVNRGTTQSKRGCVGRSLHVAATNTHLVCAIGWWLICALGPGSACRSL